MTTDVEKRQMLAEREIARYPGLHGKQKELDEDFMLDTCVSPLDIEPGKAGKFSIEVETLPAGKVVTVVSMRNHLMMGYKPQKMELPFQRKIHKLLRKGQGLMMSDSPQEMFLQYEPYKKAFGKVLTGGLGIGMFANMVARKKEVTEVVVVELEKDIIKLATPKNKKVRVIHADLWKFLAETNEKFDFIYVDIYYSTGCIEYIKTVLPMRKILEKKFPGVSAYFWGEEEMKSQYDPDFEKILKGE